MGAHRQQCIDFNEGKSLCARFTACQRSQAVKANAMLPIERTPLEPDFWRNIHLSEEILFNW